MQNQVEAMESALRLARRHVMWMKDLLESNGALDSQGHKECVEVLTAIDGALRGHDAGQPKDT